jgi:LPXTG-site transpeptidase (sortase) family protein
METLLVIALLLTGALGLAPAETSAAPTVAPPAAPGAPVYSWAPLGSGMNEVVFSLVAEGAGNLYAGGAFTSAGGTPVNDIAMWDGTSWHALGAGINNSVVSLALDGSGNLYAGGIFTSAGGAPANHIAMWDGSTWSALDSGVDDNVDALVVDESGNVYAGGWFTTAGGALANRVARWDGSSWNALGVGVNNDVDSLALDGSGNLYAGGMFTSAGGTLVNNIAMWNGSSWSALGSGVEGQILDLVFDGAGNLYAGGVITSAGGAPVNNIARWDGTSWHALGSGVNHAVWSLAVDGSGNLYAGGTFNSAGGAPVNNIARWDGTSWHPLGSGTNDRIFSLTLDGSGNLYAGGSFTIAGGMSANRVALYGQAPEVVPDGVGSLLDTGDGHLDEGETVTVSILRLTVTFSEDLQDLPGGSGGSDVTSRTNYSLVRGGTNSVSVDGVFYENNGGAGPFVATVVVNGGQPLPSGNYTFTVNGTTSVVDTRGIRLAGDGLTSGTNFVRTFTVNGAGGETPPGGETSADLPETGFTPGRITALGDQDAAYTELDSLWLEIPSLNLQMPIVGTPREGNSWDVTWLGEDAGWLEDTAYPTYPGNSVLTGHVWNADNTPGPFARLSELRFGDAVAIHSNRYVYTYEVRENGLVEPDDFSVLDHEEYDWLTLLTCQGFDERSGEYAHRRVVRAVLVRIIWK